jgi:hypothetical protein
MTIYGREELVGALARSRAPVTLLTGDSGVGKSTVLAAAQQTTQDSLAPTPRRVPHSGGALQQALLHALSDAMSAYVERRGRARELADHVVEVADRLASEGAQEPTKVVVKELLALVRGRIGDDVGKAFTDYLQQLSSTVDERLAARLTATIDPGVAGLVLDLAAEVCRFVGDQQIRLALDAGERLREEDIRLLADLSERLPERLRLHVAFSTHTDAQQQRVEFLVGSGSIVEQPVPGLDVNSIACWLADEGLDPGAASEIARVTGGYGLHLGDLMAHLKQGGSIEDAPLNVAFAHRTNEAWQSLPVDVARHARALCVFADPLPRTRLLAFLQVDATTWGAIEDRLWRTRIFSVRVNGQRWFHEQRRQYLLHEVLSLDERAAASTRAAQELNALVHDEAAIERLAELAIVVAAATPLLQADGQLAAAVLLDRDELALAASLIELIEPASSGPAVSVGTLVDYARATFGANGDLIEALRRLGQHGLVVVQGSGVAAATTLWRSELLVPTIAGRAVRELGRLPVPAAASRVFELEVRPRLGAFSNVHYGLGEPSAAVLSKIAIELGRPLSPSVIGGRTNPSSNLLVRGSYAGRGFYAAASFVSGGDRDAARERLDSLSGEILGQRFEVHDLMAHPVDPVPSRRFLNAAERLLGRRLSTPVAPWSASFSLDHPLAPEEALRRKAAVHRTIRERSSELERIAMQLDKPMGYAYFSDGDSFLEAEILGGREGVEQLPAWPDFGWDDPYAMFRVARMLNLQSHEHLSHLSTRFGRVTSHDPVIEVLGRLHLHAARFNAYQRQRYTVLLDADWLERALTQAARRNLEDARAIANAVPLGNMTLSPEPQTTYILVELDRPSPGWVPGARSTATSMIVPNPEGLEEVRVTLVYRRDEGDAGGDLAAHSAWFHQLGLKGEPYDYRGSVSNLLFRLSDMLGHKEDELRFVYSDRDLASHRPGSQVRP